MNPDFPQTPRDEKEQRLTALLLGELPAEEASALHRAMEQDAELAKLFARLHRTVGLVREAVAEPKAAVSEQTSPLKLSTARREKLLAQFKTVTPQEFGPRRRFARRDLVALAAAIAILGVLVATLLPSISNMKSSSFSAAVDAESALEVRRPQPGEPVPAAVPSLPQAAYATDALTLSGSVGRESAGYSLQYDGPPTSSARNYEVTAGFSDSPTKRPTTLTTLPARSTTTIVLPGATENSAYWAGIDLKRANKDGSDRSGGMAATENPAGNFAIPRVIVTGVTGGDGGGGGGASFGDGADAFVPTAMTGSKPNQSAVEAESPATPAPEVNVKTKFAEVTQNDKAALGFEWGLSRKVTNSLRGYYDGSTYSAGEPVNLGEAATVTAISGRSAVTSSSGVTPLGAPPLLGHAFKSAGSKADAPGDAISDGGKIAPESQVRSLDVVGYVNVPLQLKEPAGVAGHEVVRRNSEKVAFDSRQSQVAEVSKSTRDDLLTGGLRRIGVPPANSTTRRLQELAAVQKQPSSKKESEQLRDKLEFEDADMVVRKPATNAPIPQPENLTSENNFSTFSLNVSDVAFKLAAASLEQGQMPDAASVRSEEFINAFDYRDPEPQGGAPIAFASERARYPFAHNRDLLRLSLKTAAAGRQAGRPLNIVLLLDNSGSMERADRVRIIREALRVLATQLQPQDKLSVITFARTARLVADGASGSEAEAIALAASEITPQGGTNLEGAMDLAYQTAAKHYLANGINRVVLLTDGAANLGDVEPESLKQKVEAQRQQGIALDCFGIGWEGFNDDLLEVLSRNGDGRYGFINSPEAAATDFAGQLAGALKVAASDVKVQVEFNPQRVTSYRQIGYAKHQLTKEQFRDNTVDAAEIAAQEAGNALYTVEVNSAGVGPLATVRVRYKVPGTTTYREQAWDVPYTGNALSLAQSSPALRLAATAAAFAEWLVASPFAGEVTLDELLIQLRGVPEIYGADGRPKQLEWMIRQAKGLGGK
jgi:Mg-chelatase subunit ChlD